jgi:hypothetical protein
MEARGCAVRGVYPECEYPNEERTVFLGAYARKMHHLYNLGEGREIEAAELEPVGETEGERDRRELMALAAAALPGVMALDSIREVLAAGELEDGEVEMLIADKALDLAEAVHAEVCTRLELGEQPSLGEMEEARLVMGYTGDEVSGNGADDGKTDADDMDDLVF